MRRATGLKLSNVIGYDEMFYYQTRPVEFVHDFIFHKESVLYGGKYDVTWQQQEMLEAVVANDRVAVRSGRGIGKSGFASWLVLWWMAMYGSPKVVVTAPSFPQLQSVLWPEVETWLKRSLLAPYFTKVAKRLYVTEKGGGESFAEPRTASKEEAAQGLHNDDLLVIVDEAPGVDTDILETIEGSFTGENNKFVLVGNPNRIDGYFHDVFTEGSKMWAKMHFSSIDSPIVSQAWLDEQKHKHVHDGRPDYKYKIHVLGDFPEGNNESLISLYDVETAMNRDVPALGAIEIGLDVAHKGDDLCVLCTRIGNKVLPLQTKEKTTGPEIEAMVHKAVDEIRDKYKYTDTIRVKVDGTGLGAIVVDYLAMDTEHDIEVISCNFGGAGDEKYANEASIMWCNVAELITKIDLPIDDTLLRDELSTRRWAFDSRGRVKIEPKDRYKKDYKNSPDRADAVVLAFADKQNERLFVKSFDYSRYKSSIVNRERIMHGDQRYCAIYASPSQNMSAVFCSIKNGALCVFDVFIGDSSELFNTIQEYAPYTKVVGSKEMFRKAGEDLASQYMQKGLFLMEVYNYDEFGSVAKLEEMTANNDLVIATECEELIEQLRYWTAGKRQSDLRENFGLCYALTYIVAEKINMECSRSYISKQSLYTPSMPLITNINDGFLSM